MIKIKFSEQPIWSSRSKAVKKLSEAKNLENPVVELDFYGVEEISPSFANQIIFELSKITLLENIKIKNFNEEIESILLKQKKIHFSE